MTRPENVVIAIDTALEPHQLKLFSRIDFIKESHVTLVHLVQDIDYGDGVSFNIAFPNDEDKSKLSSAVITKLKQISLDILPTDFQGHVDYKCLFAEDIKDGFCKYLSSVKADLAIVASFHQHHVINISFGDYISAKAPCGVIVIKTRSPKVRKVVVGVKLDEKKDLTEALFQYDFLTTADITLLHVAHVGEFSIFSELNMTPYSLNEEKLVVEQEVLKGLDLLKERLKQRGFRGEIATVCEFSHHPKKHFLSFIEKKELELALVIRGKRKNIRGSFTQYLLHHSHVSTMVLKPEDANLNTQNFQPTNLNGHSLRGGRISRLP
jgi:hypothetical protein